MRTTKKAAARLSAAALNMAEREGFEPPVGVNPRLISSQVHSAELCHLSGACISRTRRILNSSAQVVKSKSEKSA